jgi:hypothetical protein
MRRLMFALIFFGASACATLTAAQRGELEKTAGSIASCEERGRACKADGGADCYAVYEECTRDAGLRGDE